MGLQQMLFSTVAYMDKYSRDHSEGNLSAEKHREIADQYVEATLSNLPAFQVLIEGLVRCCKANRYLLSNEVINCEEAQEVKSLFFSEMPTKLMTFMYRFNEMLKLVIAKKGKDENIIYDPIGHLRSDCELILNHHSLKYTDESQAADIRQRWLFESGGVTNS